MPSLDKRVSSHRRILGTIFSLLVVFSVVQVWSDLDHARAAVNRAASAIRMAILLAASFPGEPETQIRAPAPRLHGDLCNGRGGIRAADRQPRPAVQRGDLRQTRRPSANQARLT